MKTSLTVDNAMQYLSNVASCLPPTVRPLVNPIFTDDAFAVAPGASSHHHNYMGGLALHTAEVVAAVLVLTGTAGPNYSQPSGGGEKRWELELPYIGLDIWALLVAAMLHDYCKTLEYGYELEVVDAEGQDNLPDEAPRVQVQRIKQGSITKLPYLYTIGHVVGGAMMFYNHASQMGLPIKFIMDVLHIMLSHHGRREWGSAVEPKTPEAFVLYSADMLSAQPLPATI